MPDTMTLPEKLRSAAERPDNWDIPGLLRDAADRIGTPGLSKCPACGYYAFNGIECFDCGYRSCGNQLSNLDNCRREVVPGWTLDEILAREG